MNYFRFCTNHTSPYTKQPYGIFIAVWHLVRDGKVSEEDEATYWKTRAWFESNLPIPTYYENGNPERAITWFKESAMNGAIVKTLSIYQDIAIRYGTAIELISTETPGTIIYEDDYQIAVTNP
jgi:hypothetical protein